FTNHTLTNRLFNEMLGGDKFYGIAGQYLLNPSKYKDMLEFIYACLILGYKGKYTVDKQGDEKTLQYLLIQALHSYLNKQS
uniref:DotU family type IV/VI secretion system protein n=1 Tax=Helicobacter trogontum TaxID=50960 RepID=UPI001F24DABC